MNELNKMDVARHVHALHNQSEKIGRLYGAYHNFFYGTEGEKVDQDTLAQIEAVAAELEILLTDTQLKVDELFSLSERIRNQS